MPPQGQDATADHPRNDSWRRPSRMPTRERSAPTSAWSCRHCRQDCAPAALATLAAMTPPPGSERTGNPGSASTVSMLAARTHSASQFHYGLQPLFEPINLWLVTILLVWFFT